MQYLFGLVFIASVCYFTVWCYRPWLCPIAEARCERWMKFCDNIIDNHKGRLLAAYAVGFGVEALLAVNTIFFHGGPH